MVDEKRLAASALGGKTARACDGCLRKRARWFCPADDAFLCQACDASVHSANQLASRHERVRLETASSSSRSLVKGGGGLPMSPAWHQGFTRKARTPRLGKSTKSVSGREQQSKSIEEKMLVNHLPLVPEIGSEEDGMLNSCSMVVDNDSEEDRCPFRVPVFDPLNEELGDILTSEGPEMEVGSEEGNAIIESYYSQEVDDDHHHDHQIIGLEDFSGFQLPSDMDLAKFAADVEHLLGSEFDDDEEDSLQNKDMGFNDFDGGIDGKISFVEKGVRVKDEVVTDSQFDQLLPDHWNFDLELPVMDEEAGGEDEEEEKAVALVGISGDRSEAKKKKKNMLLRLNYEAVISAWASQGSSWTTGSRPHQLISPNHCLPNCTGTCLKDAHQPYGGLIGCRSGGGGGGEGREARVLRYKEKRRNRLFSKKIRYEVRKLNAEKRPRMKGRFVKRSSFNVGITNFP